jgi:hypothetical protein
LLRVELLFLLRVLKLLPGMLPILEQLMPLDSLLLPLQ